MKKIHKKIGAMALAGMVVAGGVAASGGKSHAASYSKASLSSLSEADYWSVREAEEIAKTKMQDLNAASLESAVSMIKGTARSMGIVVTE